MFNGLLGDDLVTDVRLFCVVAWNIWNHRNRVLQGGSPQEAHDVGQQAVSWLDEWSRANVKPRISRERAVARWRRPIGNVMKINFDGAVFHEKCLSGVRVVIRNARGEFMDVLSAPVLGVFPGNHVEALAAFKALELALSIGFNEVVLEGDLLQVINAISSVSADLSAVGGII